MTEEAIGLESIVGIGPAFAKKLSAEGVGLRELAEANEDDLDRWDVKLGLRGKPREDDWRGQAIRILSEHPEVEHASPVDPMKPAEDTAALRAQIADLKAKLAAHPLPKLAPRSEASQGRRRRRLNRHRKFSEVYGRDEEIPAGAGYVQVIGDEEVYFDHDGVELGEGLSELIEAEPKALYPEDANFINWLDKKVEYSWEFLRKAIKARWPNARVDNEKKAFTFLHEQLRQNR